MNKSVFHIPVVLVHGIWNTAAIFNPLKDYLTRSGWRVYALSMIPNNGDAPIETLAQQVADFVDASLGSEQPFHLIGFSMGGLVSRYYLQRLGGLTRVEKFVAICAPHRGTVLALGSNRAGVVQMQPHSPFLTDLNEDIHCLKAIQVFAFWTLFDLLILPPWHSQLPLGRVQRLNVASHNKMIQDPEALRAIASALKCLPPENTDALQKSRLDIRNT
ncbi:MAG: esterase/lipase family protein [Phormidesmis sp.]